MQMVVTLKRDGLAAPLVRQGMLAREEKRQLALAAHTLMQLLQSVQTALLDTVALRPLVHRFAMRDTHRPLTQPHVDLAMLVHFPTSTALFRVQHVLQGLTVWHPPSFQFHVVTESK